MSDIDKLLAQTDAWIEDGFADIGRPALFARISELAAALHEAHEAARGYPYDLLERIKRTKRELADALGRLEVIHKNWNEDRERAERAEAKLAALHQCPHEQCQSCYMEGLEVGTKRAKEALEEAVELNLHLAADSQRVDRALAEMTAERNTYRDAEAHWQRSALTAARKLAEAQGLLVQWEEWWFPHTRVKEAPITGTRAFLVGQPIPVPEGMAVACTCRRIDFGAHGKHAPDCPTRATHARQCTCGLFSTPPANWKTGHADFCDYSEHGAAKVDTVAGLNGPVSLLSEALRLGEARCARCETQKVNVSHSNICRARPEGCDCSDWVRSGGKTHWHECSYVLDGGK